MTLVKGEIESYKKVKSLLAAEGITRFNSLEEITSFVHNFEVHKSAVRSQVTQKVLQEEGECQELFDAAQAQYQHQKVLFSHRLSRIIEGLKSAFSKSRSTTPWVEAIRKAMDKVSFGLANFLENRFDGFIRTITHWAYQKVKGSRDKLEYYQENHQKIVNERVEKELAVLEETKSFLDGIYNYLAGAIGEDRVVKELEKGPDTQVLFNDFSLKFKKPIYHKAQKDRIYSIQIDHLLVTRSGIFIIETKNWSKKSISDLDMRSPIEQIRRTNYALFVLLNGKKTTFSFAGHHWGEQKVPIRNLVVMINHKPREKFKYVEVKSLYELTPYLNYFDPVLTESQVQKLAAKLESLQQ